MNEAGNNENSLYKDNFLPAYHTLKFSKDGKNSVEAVDVERRCLATRYMAGKKLDSEYTASTLLRKGLESYRDCMENRKGVNNYWPQIQTLVSSVDHDSSKWKSALKDPKTALQFLKPLSCQTDNTKGCKNKEFADHHIKGVVDVLNKGLESPRNRKISSTLVPTKMEIVHENDENIATVAHRSTTNAQNQFQKSTHVTYNGAPNPKEQKQFMGTQRKTSRNFSNNDYEEKLENSRVPRNTGHNFRTAREELTVQQSKKNNPQRRMLGGKRPLNSQFVCPLRNNEEEDDRTVQNHNDTEQDQDDCEDERLKNIDPKMVKLIRNEIMDSGAPISWNDIAGLEFAKTTIKEIVVFPLLRPDIFTGLRRPPKGILLFGPPGTGKTLIGKCIASQSKSTFFSISASCLTSKWIGEGEKMVRALFAVARVHQPAVVFIDEIDSLLSQRSESEHESSRRIKTEFLVQLDGAATGDEDRILVVGATNRPQELDEAARRRLVKRLYIPLPEFEARKQIVNNLLASERHNLTQEEISDIAKLSEGYSGADMTNLCKEASMGPIRNLSFDQLENIRQDEVRQLNVDDFKRALTYVRSSVSQADLSTYVEWDHTYGTGTALKYNS